MVYTLYKINKEDKEKKYDSLSGQPQRNHKTCICVRNIQYIIHIQQLLQKDTFGGNNVAK